MLFVIYIPSRMICTTPYIIQLLTENRIAYISIFVFVSNLCDVCGGVVVDDWVVPRGIRGCQMIIDWGRFSSSLYVIHARQPDTYEEEGTGECGKKNQQRQCHEILFSQRTGRLDSVGCNWTIIMQECRASIFHTQGRQTDRQSLVSIFLSHEISLENTGGKQMKPRDWYEPFTQWHFHQHGVIILSKSCFMDCYGINPYYFSWWCILKWTLQ